MTPEIFLLDRDAKFIYHNDLGDEKGQAGLESVIKKILQKQAVKPTTLAAKGTPIGGKSAPIIRQNPYGRISFSSELIFEQIPEAPAVHCSVIEQAPNGDLLCVWYGGNYESGDDQTIYLSRRENRLTRVE